MEDNEKLKEAFAAGWKARSQFVYPIDEKPFDLKTALRKRYGNNPPVPGNNTSSVQDARGRGSDVAD